MESHILALSYRTEPFPVFLDAEKVFYKGPLCASTAEIHCLPTYLSGPKPDQRFPS